MAIIVEEEKNRSNLTNLLGWVTILIIVLVAMYYILFAPAPAAIVTPPAGFQNLTPITQLDINPESVMNSQTFRSLKQYVPEPTPSGPTPLGRPDPFVTP